MSTSLILGLLIGLAIGGPAYYVFITYKAKKKQEIRKKERQAMQLHKKEEEQGK